MEKNQEIFWRIIAALTIISGAGLMLLNLNTESLWVDEGYTLAVSQVTISKLITPFDVHPPLFYVIEKIFSIIEKSEYAIRLPSAIASILFIILINIYAKKQFSPQGTFITTLYLALSFTLLVYSVNARNYTFLLLAFSTACLSLVTLTNTVITQKQPPPRKTKTLLAIYVTSSIICLYTHNAAIFYLTALNIVIIAFALQNYKQLKKNHITNYIILHIIIFICWIPWLSVLYETSTAFDWLTQPTPYEAARTFAAMLGPNKTPIWIALPHLITITLAIIYTIRHSSNNLRMIVITTTILIPASIYTIGFLKPIYMERTILPALIGTSLSLGFLIASIKNKTTRTTVIVFLSCVSLYSAFQFQNKPLTNDHLSGKISQNWRDAIQESSEQEIIIVNTFSIPTAYFYRKNLQKIAVYCNDKLYTIDQEKWLAYYIKPIQSGNEKQNFCSAQEANNIDFIDLNKKYRISLIEAKIFKNIKHREKINNFLKKHQYKAWTQSTKAGLNIFKTSNFAHTTHHRHPHARPHRRLASPRL